MVLPPLPVPLAELQPQLLHQVSPSQLSLAAFELLVMASERLGAGVRVCEVAPGTPAALSGIAAGDVLYTCNGSLLLGQRQAAGMLRSAAEGRTERARLTLLDGREVFVAARVAGGKPLATPFGIVHEALTRPQDALLDSSPDSKGKSGARSAEARSADSKATASADVAKRAEETLSAIRTRLNIPLRQQRWLLPILRTPLASDPPPLNAPAPTAPAYRALLLLHAGSGGMARAALGAASVGAPGAAPAWAARRNHRAPTRSPRSLGDRSACSAMPSPPPMMPLVVEVAA